MVVCESIIFTRITIKEREALQLYVLVWDLPFQVSSLAVDI